MQLPDLTYPDQHRNAPSARDAFAGHSLSRLFASSQPSAAILEAVAPLLVCYASEGLIADLEALLRDAAHLARCASASYRHANGFYKIVLAQHRMYKLRLHVWLPGAAAEENVHEHRWHFSSTVLCGRLHSETYMEDVADGSQEFDEYLYAAKDIDQQPLSHYVGKTHLLRQTESVRSRGHCYAMRPNTLHRILRTDGALTSTLMCQGAPARRTNRLLARPGTIPVVEQRHVTPEALAEVIQALLPHLNVLN